MNWPVRSSTPTATTPHTIIVDWGDGTVDEWNLRIGGRQIGASHPIPRQTPTSDRSTVN